MNAGLLSRRALVSWRLVVLIVLLAGWEAYGRLAGTDWTSEPSDIAVRLFDWSTHALALNVGVTLLEIAIGLCVGVPLGIAAGLWLGRARLAADLLRPLIVAANSVPLVALTPLLIVWFGLGLAPKVVLVAMIAFFLIFFNTFAGVRSIDEDLIATLRLMGATPSEEFRKVILPACVVWIVAGLKATLPYALIGATVGEILLSRVGVGHLITAASSEFDMTGLYAALVVLMMLGIAVNECTELLERWLLRWRVRTA